MMELSQSANDLVQLLPSDTNRVTGFVAMNHSYET